MTKRHLIATFANGEIVDRKTTLNLTHAWHAYGHDKNGRRYDRIGFAGSEDKARKAANAELRYMTHNPSGIEVVKVEIAPANFDKRLKDDKPYTIQMNYEDGRKYRVTGLGNKLRRFAFRQDAEKAMNEEIARRGPASKTTFTILEDKPKRTK